MILRELETPDDENFRIIFTSESTQKQIIRHYLTILSSSPEGLYTILKNSEKVIIDEGMCIFVIYNPMLADTVKPWYQGIKTKRSRICVHAWEKKKL